MLRLFLDSQRVISDLHVFEKGKHSLGDDQAGDRHYGTVNRLGFRAERASN